MSFYQFRCTQSFKNSVDELWDLISSPKNLKAITPDYMGFNIMTEDLPERMYEGLIIAYKVASILRINTTWVTEVTHIREKQYFLDEQFELTTL